MSKIFDSHGLAVQAAQAFKASCLLTLQRLVDLEQRLQAGDDVWPDYLDAARTLAAVLPHLQPGVNGELLTTAQMAHRLNVNPKTLLAWRKEGKVQEAQRNGARGRAALRWKP